MIRPLPPGRVSLADVRTALLAEFQRTRDPYWLGLTATRLRVIKHRHLTRGPGYDVVELTGWLDTHRAELDYALSCV